MKLIKLNCPNCNAKLEVNEEMKKFTCNYCGTTTLLDDETKRVKVSHSKLEDSILELEELIEYGKLSDIQEKAKELHSKYPRNEVIKSYYEKYCNNKNVINSIEEDERLQHAVEVYKKNNSPEKKKKEEQQMLVFLGGLSIMLIFMAIICFNAGRNMPFEKDSLYGIAFGSLVLGFIFLLLTIMIIVNKKKKK